MERVFIFCCFDGNDRKINVPFAFHGFSSLMLIRQLTTFLSLNHLSCILIVIIVCKVDIHCKDIL